jgi:hypothetical protein
MTSPNPGGVNPYQAPEADLGTPGESGPSEVDRALARKFGEQILALGAFWILMGGGAIGLSILALGGDRDLGASFVPGGRTLLVIAGIVGGAWIVLGILTSARKIWAVYAGLALCYVSLILQVLALNLCTFAILVLVILQAHRVIGWSRRLRAAGGPPLGPR